MRQIWMKLPKLVRFMAYHATWGMVLGCLFTFGLLWADVLGLRDLVAQSGLATFVLFFQMSLTFGAIAIGVAVMNLGEDQD